MCGHTGESVFLIAASCKLANEHDIIPIEVPDILERNVENHLSEAKYKTHHCSNMRDERELARGNFPEHPDHEAKITREHIR